MDNSINRKRKRSHEDSHSPQMKHYVNERLATTQNEQSMREVRDKTLGLLFRGANQKPQENSTTKFQVESVRLSGDGTFLFDGNQKPQGFPKATRKSKCCSKYSFIDSACRNCNLEVCEHCAYSCVVCRELLCSTCIMIFNCGTVDTPCCEQCHAFI